MTLTSTPTSPPPANDTFGAMLICALVAMSLYGITTLQTYFYFFNYGLDHIGTKALVGVVWALDTVHSALMCFAMYQYLIVGCVHPEIFESGLWLVCSIKTRLFLFKVPPEGRYLALSPVTIHFSMFLHKTHPYLPHSVVSPPSSKSLISVPIACIVVCHFAFGIDTVIRFSIKKKFALLSEVTDDTVIPFGIFAILSDISIAFALVLLLRRKRSGFEDTNSLIKKLVAYAINRCILTSVLAVLQVILFMSFPNSMYAFAFDFIIGKLYVNSLLASLNSRKSLRRKKSPGVGSTRSSTRFSTVLYTMQTYSGAAQYESPIRVASGPRMAFHNTDTTTGSQSIDERRRSMNV
ncbi:hypothetical protein BDP27DRAFT_1421219 [Rhodocollybia butyracea]|uniref:DUF6534 domain-containing protein n=1 Tax=Rhodocollybia butyracea TaxID=206335 RepID=A0A9P5PSK7_9AGAR|nr:hypothetical protein BDP27DRAFT_1421219 [Rhodocollybia butyracea]